MKSLLSFFWGWFLIVCAIVFSVHFTALDSNFYTSRYEATGMAESLNVSSKDLNNSIEVLLDYIKGSREDMDLEITRNGIEQEAFNTREKTHMVDVRNLYQNAIKAGILSFIGLIVILFGFSLRARKQMISYLTKGFLQAIGCFVILLVFIGGWALYDFTAFWNWFHTIFFSNDLWLLNPATDFMICMLPESIFSSLVMNIVLMVLFILVPITLFSVYYQLKRAPIGFDKS